jgi:hypothetical protein
MNGENEGEREWRGWSLLAGERGENSAKTKGGGGRRLQEEEIKIFRVRYFLLFFFLSKMPPPVWLKMKAIYRQSSFFGLQNWSLKFCVWPLISNNSLGKN